MVHLPHLSMTTGKTIALTSWTSIGKVMSLLFSMLSRFVIAFYPRSKQFLIALLQSPSAVILESKIQKLLLLYNRGRENFGILSMYLFLGTPSSYIHSKWTSVSAMVWEGSNNQRFRLFKGWGCEVRKSPKPAAMLAYSREILKWINKRQTKKSQMWLWEQV